ncbi:hypothetical protein [Deminuibacter soli]|uniref:LamG domain-containing protein n=1 Tax=Deminuibacter soli TaxID=2291815 RepID=A0A3E1NES3_9BACT|nr:hypothetical protein [Deminuibacter soli]RFM26485.1 hypothetical protein DXN05_19875 [Deminuibacter soli]
MIRKKLALIAPVLAVAFFSCSKDPIGVTPHTSSATSNWRAFLPNEQTNTEHWFDSGFVSNDVAHFDYTNVPGDIDPSYLHTGFVNVVPGGITIKVDSVTFTERVIVPTSGQGAVAAYDFFLYVFGTNDSIVLRTVGTSEKVLSNQFTVGSAGVIGDASLVKTFNQWATVKLAMTAHQASFYINDQLVKTVPYTRSIGTLKRIWTGFKGSSGSIDWITVSYGTKQYMSSNFDLYNPYTAFWNN